jgi:REP element-mobilizing transposase RayT
LHGIVTLADPYLVDAAVEAQPSLSSVIQWFKTMTTNAYIRGVKAQGWPPFRGHLWQRSFYDHIVREHDRDLDRIREYIIANRFTWHDDDEYVAHETAR